jgi:hypothetical protein
MSHPYNYDAVPRGLEPEAGRALNAAPLSAVITVKYHGNGESVILVNNKPSPSLNTMAMHTSVDETLDMLASNGRAVTTYREANADNPFS